jgi:glycosyltransferase 2 family protein
MGVLLWHFGAGPFLEAGRVTTWPALLAASLITAACTLSSAWRWRVVAQRCGVPLTTRASVAAYYRSQFLNSTLPGGIVGDAHRAVRHGREAADVPAGLRATAWDRVSGQVVQISIALAVLVALPSPLRRLAPVGILLVGTLVYAIWTLARRPGRLRDTWVTSDLRSLLEPPTAVKVGTASLGSTAGHVGVFLVAAWAVGVDASWSTLVPAALVVLVMSALPISVAGWGPREGATVWVFGLAGLGSADGLTVSVVYGVLAAVATLPGAAVLVHDAVRRRTPKEDDGARREVTHDRIEPALEEVHRG